MNDEKYRLELVQRSAAVPGAHKHPDEAQPSRQGGLGHGDEQPGQSPQTLTGDSQTVMASVLITDTASRWLLVPDPARPAADAKDAATYLKRIRAAG